MDQVQIVEPRMSNPKPEVSGIALDPMLQSLVEAHHEPFALIDHEFNIVAANRIYAEHYAGKPPAVVVGLKCHEVSHKSEATCNLNGEECPLTHVFENSNAYQVIHRHFDCRHDPDYVAIHGSPILGPDGEVRYMGESITSISRDEDLRFDEQKLVAGCCPSFMGVLDNLVVVAGTDAPVLIAGETGTGKELTAQLIHRKSRRSLKEFVPVDCTLFTEEMFASELFGHVKGAFTGAMETKRGLYEMADGGTLFLDEIGEMHLAIQAKLLRALESGTYRRVGDTKIRHAEARILCATNRDLKTMVDEGRFRADLYYRINCMQVELPPLRHRSNDIPELATYFLTLGGKKHARITDAALEMLKNYPFPGNVRELRNILERASILAKGMPVEVVHLPKEVIEPALAPQPHPVHREKDFFVLHSDGSGPTPEQIQRALDQHGGNRRLAAQTLGISERTLYRRLK
jgi:transcriptional regulator with PAS, ATPase and Fis domain